MEYVKGVPLAQLIDSGILTEPVIAAIAQKVKDIYLTFDLFVDFERIEIYASTQYYSQRYQI